MAFAFRPNRIPHYLLRLLPLVLLLAAAAGCRRVTVIARIDNQTITARELRDFLSERALNADLFATHEQRAEYLEQLIDYHLMLRDARAQGWGRDPALLARLESMERGLVEQEVREREVLGRAVPRDEVRRIYNRMGIRVRLRHLLLRCAPDSPDSAAMEQRLMELRSRLMRGASFSELVRAFSQDSATAAAGGEMGWLRWGALELGDAFYQAAFDLKLGRVSLPVRSPLGYHLIQFEGQRRYPKPAFNELAPEIRRRLRPLYGPEIERSERAFRARLRRMSGIELNEINLEWLLSRVKDLPDGNAPVGPALAARFEQGDAGRVLIHYPDRVYTVADFLAGEDGRMLPSFTPFLSLAALKDHLAELIPYEELAVRWGYDHGLQQSEPVRRLLAEQRHGLMVRAIEHQRVFSQMPEITEVDLEDYYQQNRERYTFPEKRNVQEIFVADSILAERIAQRARAGEDFDALARRYNERSWTQSRNGVMGYLSVEQQGEIGKTAASLDSGGISGPINVKLGYSVIRVLDIRPERLKSFVDARREVRADLYHEISTALRRDWLARLRQRSLVQIYPGRLRRAFRDGPSVVE